MTMTAFVVKGLAGEEPDIVWEDSCPSGSSSDDVNSIHRLLIQWF